MTDAQVDRFIPQADLVPRARLLAHKCMVIGVGAVGRAVAWQLAAIGAGHITLVDFDRVEPRNVTTQAYLHADIGKAKVDATAEQIAAISPDVVIEKIDGPWSHTLAPGSAIFCCVDDITVRRKIWETYCGYVPFWVDTRMQGEIMRIICATSTQFGHYVGTLFKPEDAEPGRCTAHATVYTAFTAASLAVREFSAWLRGGEQEVDPDFLDFMLDLGAKTLVPTEDKPLPEVSGELASTSVAG